QVLVRMRGTRNPHALLVRMQTGTTTMEISVIVPQETRNRPRNITKQYHAWAHSKDSISCYRDTCSSIFIVALFTIAKAWSLHRYRLDDTWIMGMWRLYVMECIYL
ncbi:mCG145188, partial [Mus musculus]